MDSTRLLLLICVCSLITLTCGADVSELESRSLRNFYPKDTFLSSEKELVSVDLQTTESERFRGTLEDMSRPDQISVSLGALQEVLEKLQSKRLPTWEKKFGQLPLCDTGEQCAVRKGARIGKLCDCPRSTGCNFFLLKCL